MPPESFERQATLSLFPTLVWVFDLKEAEVAPINLGILGWLDRIADPRPKALNDLSLQTDHDFHLRPEFYRLGLLVTAAVRAVMDNLQLAADQPEITGCWINVSPEGTRHHEHSHPNNYLSGVYYVRTPPGAGSISFYDPRPQAHIVSPPAQRFTPMTASSMTVSIQPGRLLLFHSWLRHAVEANRGSEERISLSFNLMFGSFAERFSRPMWTPKITEKRGP